MGNTRKKLIRIYGVTLANSGYGIRSYGHGVEKVKAKDKYIFVEYVDYFIDDLIRLIQNQELKKIVIKKLK